MPTDAADAENNAPNPVAIAEVPSPIGPLWLATRAGAAFAIEWDGEAKLRAELRRRGVDAIVRDRAAVAPLERALEAYFAGRPLPVLDYDFSGMTPFTAQVLRALLGIGRGETTSYGALAVASGRPVGAARAVGGAVGRNPMPILVPCHRVLQGDGSLGGFSGGLARKRWLLNFESIRWREPQAAAERSAA